ncbi:hypothetical protein CEXT_679281 [Caerostris extrusa]|uniref:Uncharacterized protein n=1 Tax=Caerostris extrusa TaxID=172846 RepID=A0AAV4NJM4_CAEEX|nr:hypothetical protein CEXT_679281 [Caerostris extrusa]
MASDKGLQTKFELQCKTSGAKEDKLTIQSIQKWLKESGVIGKDTGITDSDVQTVWTTIVKDKKNLITPSSKN